MKNSLIIISIIFLGICINAKEKSLPPWVIFEKAKSFMSQGEFGQAIEHFKEALVLRPNYPEAHMAIADIYWQVEGEFLLAERYYKKAIENKVFLEIPNQKYQIMEKLGNLYYSWTRYFDYHHILIAILSEDSEYFKKEFKGFENTYYNLYIKEGFNQLFRLFRIDDYSHVIKAHRELGWFFYKSGQYKDSINHSLFSLINMLTKAFNHYREFRPLYKYEDLQSFIKDLYEKKAIAAFLDEHELFKALYYLGASSYAQGKIRYSKEIFTIIVRSSYRGRYYNQAQKQLKKPYIEEVIYKEKEQNPLDLNQLIE